MTFSEFKNIYTKLNSEEERNKFIDNRIMELVEEAPQIESIGMGINGSYSDFIAPTVGIVSNKSGMFSKLVLDDMDLYKKFMNFIENDVEKNLYGEPYAIIIIQNFIWNYFGYNAGNILERMDIYSDGNEFLSVKELKGKNIGACSERSAMVQNLLKFLGFDSEIIFGKLNNKESHAYIIFKSENGKNIILYDPMNPVEYKNGDKTNYSPGICLVSEEEYKKLKGGQTFDFKYDLVKKIYIRDAEFKEVSRNYTCDDIEYDLNDDELHIKSSPKF